MGSKYWKQVKTNVWVSVKKSWYWTWRQMSKYDGVLEHFKVAQRDFAVYGPLLCSFLAFVYFWFCVMVCEGLNRHIKAM